MSSYAAMDRHFPTTLTARFGPVNAEAIMVGDGGQYGDVSLGRYSTVIKPVSIPISAPVNHQPFTYTVAAGEDLNAIASKFHVTVAEIRWSNTNLISTDSVATKRNVTWNGDAGYWYANAAAQGYSVGSAPKVGSIMVTWESWAGHVAYVEAVNPDGSWTVSEMNWVAFDVIDERTIKPGQLGQKLVGFIY